MPIQSPRGALGAPAAPLAAIVGPTASGKSELAMALAQRLPVEILVADSRQVYRGMDIGTAKPDGAARAAVPHHLLDLATPDELFTVADWVERARDVVAQVAARGALPLVVGGTGLYVSALVDGLSPAGRPSPELRAQLNAELAEGGLDALAAHLAERDPMTAARIDLRNPRRVLRALERLAMGEGSGGANPYPGRLALLGISRPREALRQRIAQRAAWMFANGLVDEVRRLMSAGYGPDLAPMTGHGYREAARVAMGEWDVAEAVAVTARHTAQYAKRQMTWFRRDRRIVWLPAGSGPADAAPLLERALAILRALLA
ncbi:MAG TPA: tRNA (adenosine(37)-N6)-dimethylallyltransferase MiaA [Candidatus Limnocylindria bacterium]